jgi:hypothetical protein
VFHFEYGSVHHSKYYTSITTCLKIYHFINHSENE